ncbi:MAG: hypothetical protein LBK59_01060, partial [Bifidobacteriaceae bacterium]|nr:hypothetical protein [Bifidobacteriaceae bacterium]
MRKLLTIRGRRRNDAGIAMVAIVASFTIVMVVVLGSLAFLSQSTKYSRFEQDTDLALAAAEAGIADVLTELRIDPEYMEKIAATKAEPTGYCRKQATGGPAAEGDAFAAVCGWASDMTARWQPLGPASAGQEYHYAITEAPGITQYFQITSTGRAGGVYRTVRASIARETAQQWVYFGNYSMGDPWDTGIYSDTTAYLPELTSAACGGGWTKGSNLAYAWEIIPGAVPPVPARQYDKVGQNNVSCVQGYATDDYVYDGPVHQNDTLFVDGAIYNRTVTTSDPACQNADEADPSTWALCVKPWHATTLPQFNGGAPSWRPRLDLASVGDAKHNSVNGLGCRYTGPTRILLEGNQMRVWSRETEAVDERPGCGSVADLHSVDGATVPLAGQDFIFVDSATGVPGVEIGAGAIGGAAGKVFPLGNYDPAITPTAGAQYSEEVSMSRKDKEDGMGNLWVEGHWTGGNLTIATDRTIVITGDLITDDHDTDLLGLLAGDAVEMMSPVMQTVKAVGDGAGGFVWDRANPAITGIAAGWPSNTNQVNRRVEAAIYAATASFRVQNSGYGSMDAKQCLGKVEVFGSVAENFG